MSTAIAPSPYERMVAALSSYTDVVGGTRILTDEQAKDVAFFLACDVGLVEDFAREFGGENERQWSRMRLPTPEILRDGGVCPRSDIRGGQPCLLCARCHADANPFPRFRLFWWLPG